jgi:hypothetical protein
LSRAIYCRRRLVRKFCVKRKNEGRGLFGGIDCSVLPLWYYFNMQSRAQIFIFARFLQPMRNYRWLGSENNSRRILRDRGKSHRKFYSSNLKMRKREKTTCKQLPIMYHRKKELLLLCIKVSFRKSASEKELLFVRL